MPKIEYHGFGANIRISNSYDKIAVDGLPIARSFDRLVKDKSASPFNEYFDDTILKLVKDQNISQNSTIIDMGCGNGKTLGRLLNELFLNPTNLIGFDVSTEMITIAKENFPLIEFHKSDIRTAFKNKENVADIITSINVVHYLPSVKELEKFYKNVFRLLKPKGHFLLVTSDEESIYKWRNMTINQFKGWINKGREPMDWSMPEKDGSPAFRLQFYPYLNGEHYKALEQAGFSCIKTYRQFPPEPKIAQLNNDVYNLLQKDPVFIFFVAKKK
jgi:SAM-dependent methyltransferase